MVDIVKDGHKLTVTKGAFKHIFQKQGYTLLDGSETAYNAVSDFHNTETVPHSEKPDMGHLAASDGVIEENIDAELEEKPVSEMTFKELKRYAQNHGIDTTDMTGKKDVKRALREKGLI